MKTAAPTSDPRNIPGVKDKPQPGPTDPGPDPAPATPAALAAPAAPEPTDRADVATDTTPDDGQPTSNEELTDPGASANNDAHPL